MEHISCPFSGWTVVKAGEGQSLILKTSTLEDQSQVSEALRSCVYGAYVAGKELKVEHPIHVEMPQRYKRQTENDLLQSKQCGYEGTLL